MLLQWEQVEILMRQGFRPYPQDGGMVMPGPRSLTWFRMERWDAIARWLDTPEAMRPPAFTPEEREPGGRFRPAKTETEPAP